MESRATADFAPSKRHKVEARSGDLTLAILQPPLLVALSEVITRGSMAHQNPTHAAGFPIFCLTPKA